MAEIVTIKNEPVFNYAEMIRVMRQLSSILEQEIALLQDMKIARIHESYDAKMELSDILEVYKEMLSGNPDLVNSIPSTELEILRQESIRFEELVAEDGKQIKRAREVHALVMDAVRKSLEQNMIMESGYNRKGVVDFNLGNNSATPPVSINQNI